MPEIMDRFKMFNDEFKFQYAGNGKSSTGNSIVGKQVFVTKSDEDHEHTPITPPDVDEDDVFDDEFSDADDGVMGVCSRVTMECKSEIVETPSGRPKLRVIDTPCLLNLTLSKDIVRCLHLAEGGLDAVLLVLSVGNRLTKEDEVVLRDLKLIFGSKIVDYLIVVFTAGDVLEEDNETIESYLDRCPDFLKRLLESCEQRMVVFDNKTKNEEKKTKQFQELLNTIDLVKKHTNYKPYTEDMYHKERAKRNKKKDEVPMPKFSPPPTESVFSQMRSQTEAQKAREDKHDAEEEKRLKEMQKLIDQMQSSERSEMEKKSEGL